jgi:hypothetical protein
MAKAVGATEATSGIYIGHSSIRFPSPITPKGRFTVRPLPSVK